MASVEEQQLAQLRAANEQEIAAQRARMAKLEADLAQMQEDTEVLEKEEKALEQQFGDGANTGGDKGPSEVGAYVKNILKGLVDGDDSKCRMR